MHLFILGTVIIVLLRSKSSLAWTFALTSSVLCMLHTTYIMLKNDAPPFILSTLSATKMCNFMNYVHMVTSTYVPAYMIGMITGYFILEKRSNIQFKSNLDVFVKISSTFILFLISLLSSASTGLLDIPDILAPVIVILCRIVWPVSWACLLLLFVCYYQSEEKDQHVNQVELADDKSNQADDENIEQPINIIRGINRLSTPVFFINYVVIRTIFFQERAPYDTRTFPLVSNEMQMIIDNILFSFFISYQVSRILVTIIYSYGVAFCVQLILLSPMNLVRKWLLKIMIKSKEKEN